MNIFLLVLGAEHTCLNISKSKAHCLIDISDISKATSERKMHGINLRN